MSETSKPLSPRRVIVIAAAVAAICGPLGAMVAAYLPIPHPGTDRAVHDYILSHPEILPEAVEKLKAQDGTKQVAQLRPQIEKAWPGAVMGNPNGKVVLVEFMDFACGYCRQSLGDVDRLIGANPDLKVVLRELPILSPESADAAKMALAAAAQGKYGAFHKAMFAAGRPNADTIAAAARTAGLDPVAAAKIIADPATQAEIESNLTLARALGLNGTPSWLAGDQMLGGALGYDALAKAVAAARH